MSTCQCCKIGTHLADDTPVVVDVGHAPHGRLARLVQDHLALGRQPTNHFVACSFHDLKAPSNSGLTMYPRQQVFREEQTFQVVWCAKFPSHGHKRCMTSHDELGSSYSSLIRHFTLVPAMTSHPVQHSPWHWYPLRARRSRRPQGTSRPRAPGYQSAESRSGACLPPSRELQTQNQTQFIFQFSKIHS